MQTLLGLDIALRIFPGSFAQLQSLWSVNQTAAQRAHTVVLSARPRPLGAIGHSEGENRPRRLRPLSAGGRVYKISKQVIH